jgi:DNA polymerase-4
MYSFLYLELQGFYIREWERSNPESTARAIAIHRDKTVLDLNDSARSAGVRLGMGLAEAKVLMQGQGLVPYEEELYREARDRWLDALAEFSSTIEPDQMRSAWADLSGHPQLFDVIAHLKRRIEEVAGLPLRMGLAGTKWLSKAASKLVGDADPVLWEVASREAMATPAAFLADLPVSVLGPLDQQTVSRLNFLGYRKVGEVSALSLRTLKSQFGNEAVKIRAVSHGGFQEPVRPLYPPEEIVAKVTFTGGISNSEELRNGLEWLSRKLAKQLSDREAAGSSVEVRIIFEHSDTERKRTFSKMIRTARQAFMALERIVGIPHEDVHAVVARMPALRKAQERQSDLFSARATAGDRAADRAVDRIRLAFGDKSVVRASEISEPRRIKVLRAWSHATGWK